MTLSPDFLVGILALAFFHCAVITGLFVYKQQEDSSIS